MLKPYRTIQDVLASRWVLSPPAERHRKTDRVLRSTKLESSIYRPPLYSRLIKGIS